MLLTKGRIATSEPWNILEVAIGQSPDILAVRLSKELKKIHEPAVQALVPFRRNSDGDAEWIIEHVYIRGANGSLSRLARTPGIDFIRKELAEAVWIQELLKSEQVQQTHALNVGDFVRVLTGPCARLCGNLENLRSTTASVLIEMRTKSIRVHTHPKNLQPIQCLPEHRVFFYQSELFS